MRLNHLLIVFLGLIFALMIIKGFQRTVSIFAFIPIYEQFKVLDNIDPGSDQYKVSNTYKSYLLLDDKLPGYPPTIRPNGPTSQRCYQTDASRTLEKAGSYMQVTNNFKHGYPDSCSSWNHDLVLDFYKPKRCQ